MTTAMPAASALPILAAFVMIAFAAFASADAGAKLAGQAVTRTTKLSLADTLILMEESAARQGFRILAKHDLQASLRKEGFERDAYTVVELCNAEAASSVLGTEPTAGSLLPCRIAVYRQGGETVLATTLPSALLGLVVTDKPDMIALARQIDRVMVQVMDDATKASTLSAQALWSAVNRSYKNALVETGTGQPEAARGPLNEAVSRWKTFIDRFGANPPAPYDRDSGWSRDLAAVTKALGLAQESLFSGKVESSHEELEPVRRLWMELRTRNGVDAFGDRVTSYHDAMEPMLQAVTGVQSAASAEQAATIASLLPAAEKAWQNVLEGAPKDNQKLNETCSATTKLLASLKGALGQKDLARIPEAVRALKPAFMKLYLKFG